MCGGGGGGSSSAAREQRRQEELRKQRIREGRAQLANVFGHDTQQAANRNQQAYLDFVNPQLDSQMRDANSDLIFALARQGQTAGSLAGDRFADLNRDFNVARQDVANQGLDIYNQTKQNINDLHNNMLNLLQSSADPDAVTNQARMNLTSATAAPKFNSLGPLFQNVTAGLGGTYMGNQNFQNNQAFQNALNFSPASTSSGVIRR